MLEKDVNAYHYSTNTSLLEKKLTSNETEENKTCETVAIINKKILPT